MLKIGLTGGIGSGKSTVASIFKVLGIPVYMADDATRQLMNEDAALKKAILEEFGEQSYVDGQLNRPYLASIVFNEPARLDKLNALTHPVTIRHAREWMSRQQASYVIKEAALIFESGSAENLDYVIGVYAPRTIRIKRVMDRDGVAREEVIKRMNRQIDEELKMKLCDFVLVNDEQQLLIPQVLALDEKFRTLAAAPA
jgi:dephospho-CoA kinase